MKKIIPLLIILCSLCGCSQKNTETINPAEQAKKDSLALKVALMPTLDCLPFFYAERCGIYKSLGLDVRLLTFNAQMDCDTALTRKHVDVSYTDLVRASLMQAEGTGLYVIMRADGNHYLVSNKSKRLRSTKNLKERLVAIARHSVTDLLLDTVVAQAKVDPTVVYHPQINDITVRYDMVNNGTIDAGFLPEPYATQARLQGHNSIYDSKSNNISLMAFSASYNAVNDKNRQEQIKNLIKGYNMAVQEINKGNNRDSITNILHRYPVNKATSDSLRMPKFKPAANAESSQIETAVRFLRGRRLIDNSYKADTLTTDLFIKQ